MFNHRDNFSYSYTSSICLSPSLTHPYWRNCLFVSASHRQPTFGACQTKAAVSKHLITARGDAQDWHSWHCLNCLRSPFSLTWSQARSNGDKKKKKQIRLILRCHVSRVSALVIPNLSHITSEGDNGADALCRCAVITDGISVRVWMYVISGFRLSQTPLVVLKTIVTPSWAERCVRQRTWPEAIHRGWTHCWKCVLFCIQTAVMQSVCDGYWDYYIASPFDWASLQCRRETQRDSCGTSKDKSNVFVSVIKFSWTNGLITLVAMICMSWVSPAVLIRGQSLWQCCCHQVVHWGTSSVNEARCLACPKTSHTDTCMYNTVSTLTWLFFLSALQMEQLQTCLESILERHSTHAAKWIIY